MKINKTNPAHWILLAKQAVNTLIAILLRPFFSKPATPIVILYGHQLSGNLKALYEEWKYTRIKEFTMYFLSLDPQYTKTLDKLGINTLRCNRLSDMLILCKTSVIITDHGLHAMKLLVKFTNIKFVDVWHGIPFKGFDQNDFKLQHRYSEIWVSSLTLKDLYVQKFGFNEKNVKALGYARTDKLFKNSGLSNNYKIILGIPDARKVILYAPTWQQDEKDRELFPFGETEESFLKTLNTVCEQNNAFLLIRNHLNSQITPRAYPYIIYCSQKDYPDTEDLLLISDILICDWSSIAFDFLALNKPALFLDVPAPFSKGFSLRPEYRFGKIITDITQLSISLEYFLNFPEDYRRLFHSKYNHINDRVYGTLLDGKSGARQLDRIIKLLKRTP